MNLLHAHDTGVFYLVIENNSCKSPVFEIKTLNGIFLFWI